MAWWSRSNLHPKTKSKFVVVFGNDFFLPNVKTVVKPKVEFETKEYRLINHKFNYPGNSTWQPVDIKFVDMNGLALKQGVFDTAAFLWQILNNTGYAYPFMDVDSQASTNPYYKKIVKGQVSPEHGHYINTEVYFQDQTDTSGFVEGRGWKTLTTPEKSSTIANSFGGGLAGRRDEQEAHYSRQKISIYQISPEHPNDTGDVNNPAPGGAIITEAWHLVNPIVKSIDWGDLSYDSDELVEYGMNIVYDWAIYDRDSIGKNVYDLGYSTEMYDKFTKQWNNLSERVESEIQRQRVVEAQEAAAAARDTFGDFTDPEQFETFASERFIDDAIDLDGDGTIDDNERAFYAEQGEAFLEDFADAESIIEEMQDSAEAGQALGEAITQNLEEQAQFADNLGGVLSDAIEYGEEGDDIYGIATEGKIDIQAAIDEKKKQAQEDRWKAEARQDLKNDMMWEKNYEETKEEERNKAVIYQDESGRDVTFEEALLRQEQEAQQQMQELANENMERDTNEAIDEIFADDDLGADWLTSDQPDIDPADRDDTNEDSTDYLQSAVEVTTQQEETQRNEQAEESGVPVDPVTGRPLSEQ